MLTHDELGKAYWNAVRVPRTTELCQILAPREWSADEYSLRKGQLIHRIIEWENTKELDESSVDPALQGYLYAYRKCKRETGFRIIKIEFPFYSRRYGYCGRVDLYVEIFNYFSVIDLKSGQPHEADMYQGPLYLFGLKDSGFSCWRAFDLYLKDNGKYKLVEIEQPSRLFMKALTSIPRWKEINDGNLLRIEKTTP